MFYLCWYLQPTEDFSCGCRISKVTQQRRAKCPISHVNILNRDRVVVLSSKSLLEVPHKFVLVSEVFLLYGRPPSVSNPASRSMGTCQGGRVEDFLLLHQTQWWNGLVLGADFGSVHSGRESLVNWNHLHVLMLSKWEKRFLYHVAPRQLGVFSPRSYHLLHPVSCPHAPSDNNAGIDPNWLTAG